MRRSTARCALIAASVLGACAGGYDALTSLRNAVDEFHDGFRWGAMGSMLPHLPPDAREDFHTVYEAAMQDVQLADYEVTRVRMADDKDSAQVWIRVSWFSQREMVVHDATIRERWIWNRPDWLRAEAVVERGEMPGIPAEADAP